MYESHFGLTRPPFQITPDASFIFQGKAYRGAIDALREGLTAGVKVMAVTGEPGVGKTTLLQAFLAGVDPAATSTAHISASGLDAERLVDRVSQALGLPRLEDPAARREALLARLHSAPTATLLVIDEAQHLEPSAFDLLETLANGAGTASARLQICLLGQPQLRMLLNAPDRGAFRALVGVDRHLGPLEQAEIRLYVEHRLHRAGWSGRPEFEDAAFFEIFILSGGVPRRVNLLCNSLMLAAALEKEPRIDAPAVSRAAAAIQGDAFPSAIDLLDVDPQVAQPPPHDVGPQVAQPRLHDVEPQAVQPPLLAEALQASPPEPADAAAADDVALRTQPVRGIGAIPATQSVLADAALHRQQHSRRRNRQAILASAASVAIALVVIAIVYVVDQRSAPADPSQVAQRSGGAKRATGSVAPTAGPAGNVPSPAALSPAAAPARATPAASAAASEPATPPPAPTVPEPPVPAPAPAAPSTQPSCSGPAFALGLCDAEGASASGRK